MVSRAVAAHSKSSGTAARKLPPKTCGSLFSNTERSSNDSSVRTVPRRRALPLLRCQHSGRRSGPVIVTRLRWSDSVGDDDLHRSRPPPGSAAPLTRHGPRTEARGPRRAALFRGWRSAPTRSTQFQTVTCAREPRCRGDPRGPHDADSSCLIGEARPSPCRPPCRRRLRRRYDGAVPACRGEGNKFPAPHP